MTADDLAARIVDGRTDLVLDLISAGRGADAVDQHGVPMIKWCAYYGDVTAVRCLAAAGASLDLLGKNYDLNGAAFHGHWRLCQYLLEQGADADLASPTTGETPLHAALSKAGRPAYNLVVKVLLAAGADPGRATISGVETGSFMRDCRTRGETPLHRAAAFGDVEAIQLLLDAGANVEARDAHGETPLAWASWHLRPGAVLERLCYGQHQISAAGVRQYVGDHGAGW
ncbi:MAG TPA: ankyrin repeat domain-containing protein, partial [Lacipirellulaceae bacterium]|nr:ankyrin repeat domain-containing protein [Lacipirellulaceae bacterium]